MESAVKYINSQEAAKILGVNVSSIKRWTDEGKLECIQTVGGHRKFLMEHLASFVKKNKKKASKVNVFSIETSKDLEINYHVLKGDFDFLKSFVLKQVLKNNRDEIQKVLTGLHLGQYPLYMIYDHLITPVLYEIGRRWMKKKLSVTEEHIASQIIRDSVIRLQGIIRVPQQKIGRAICLNLSSELHDIALKMVQNILEVRGFRTYFSGQKTPFLDLDQLLKQIKPNRLYISSTVISNRKDSQQEIEHLFRLSIKNKTGVFVGGSGFDQLKYNHFPQVQRLSDFEEVFNS
jgi:excisionase family DNA binding protein